MIDDGGIESSARLFVTLRGRAVARSGNVMQIVRVSYKRMKTIP